MTSEGKGDVSSLVAFDLRPWALREIRRRAAVAGNVVVIDDVRNRTAERGLFSYDILHVLRTGRLDGQPRDLSDGGISCRMKQRIRRRRAFVEVVIFGEDKLFVSVTDWEG